MRVHRVEDGDLFVQHHIGVVGHTVWHQILALEQVNLMVVYADILDILGDFHYDSPL